MKKSVILLFIIMLAMPVVASAQRALTGKVVDAENGQPLIGASLYWKNTTAGATTAVDGSFTLKRQRLRNARCRLYRLRALGDGGREPRGA